ncbi:hypothetical protein [Amycolatopsis sp. NPDC051061]|uniref:hypothetical protein n=1 Tax=Amycolatopsis sp. NPDC051061 TaxID=3155042 RepID=UPI003427CC48
MFTSPGCGLGPSRPCNTIGRGNPTSSTGIYRALCRRLSWLHESEPHSPVSAEYQELVNAYNATHPGAPVQRLHVPFREFPDELAGHAQPGAVAAAGYRGRSERADRRGAAAAGHQWGVLILEGTWSVISSAGLALTLKAVLA